MAAGRRITVVFSPSLRPPPPRPSSRWGITSPSCLRPRPRTLTPSPSSPICVMGVPYLAVAQPTNSLFAVRLRCSGIDMDKHSIRKESAAADQYLYE